MHTAKYISLEDVVKNYMSEADYSGAAFLRMYHLAIRGYDDIWQDISRAPKTRKLTVLDNKTVELPSDYVQWIKVGVINEKGEVATLRRNDKLSGYAATDNSRNAVLPTLTSDQLLDTKDYMYRNFYDDGINNYYNLFGLPAGTQNIGEFKVLDEDGVIILSPEFGDSEIILEYLATPYQEGETVLIPIQIREAIIAWLAWMDIRSRASSRRVNIGEKQIRRREYYNQRRLARARLQPFRTGDINDVVRMNNNLTVKP